MMEGDLSLMVMAPLEPVSEGQVFDHTPHHLTVLPWFSLPTSDWRDFDSAMRDLVIEEGYPVVMGGESAMFGPKNTKPARKLGGVLFGVHAHAIRIARDFDISIDPTYTALDYVPHVSSKPDRQVEQDEQLLLNELVVIERVLTKKRARSVYTMGTSA